MSHETEQLGQQIARFAAEITAVTYKLIEAIGAFDRLGGWAHQGAISCAQWLSYRIGMDVHSAREKVRVARALEKLPRIAKKFEEGRLSYSKVRAITRVGTPENEQALLDVAMASTAYQLEQICRRFRGVVERSAPSLEEAEIRRYVSQQESNGMMRFTIQVSMDEGARLLAAIEQGALAAQGDVPAGTPEGATKKRMNRADGLMAVAETFLADGPKTRKGGAAHEVRLHVAEDELAGRAEGAFIANAGCHAVSPDTARRIACDAGVVRVVEDAAGKILDVGRRTRTVPSAIRRALDIRDGATCSFPGCQHRLFLDAHHIEHWIDGGKTSLDNLILLCRRHHTFVHEHGYTVGTDAEGKAMFTAPKGPALPRSPVPPSCTGEIVERLALDLSARGLPLDEIALIPPGYDGEPVRYSDVIDALVSASPSAFPEEPSVGIRCHRGIGAIDCDGEGDRPGHCGVDAALEEW
jgi:hypothetical protein